MQKVCIWTPDKDLAQCVSGDRVVQVDRRSGLIRDAAGVARSSASRRHIPGLPGAGRRLGRRLSRHQGHRGGDRRATVERHGAIEQFPEEVLGDRREQALLFKTIATLRTDAPLFDDVDELRWHGPTGAFGSLPSGFVDDALTGRVGALLSRPSAR